jgi:hypothetical protein
MPFPPIYACLVCEVARPEPEGKFNLLGYFGLCPDVKIGIRDFNAPVVFCFVFGAHGSSDFGGGHYRLGIRVTSENGMVVNGESVDVNVFPNNSGSNIFMNFRERLPGPGNYTASLLVDGQPVYDAKFQLGPALASLTPAPLPGRSGTIPAPPLPLWLPPPRPRGSG